MPDDKRSLLSRGEVCTLFAVALAVRLLAILVLGTAAEAEGKLAWDWGWEPASMAAALAGGQGFGSPFGVETGPSGWLTPLYPLIIAACLHVFDGVNAASATALFTLHALVSAWTVLLVARLGEVLRQPQVGRWAAWLFAFYPASIWYAAGRVWDSTLVAAALLAFVVALLRSGPQPTLARTAKLGAGYGAMLLLNPAPIGILPVILLYLGSGRVRQVARRWSLFGAVALAVCSPWMLHNWVQVGSPGLRSNFGVELRVGNNDDADGRHQTQYHPADPRNTPRYVLLGEAAYADEARSAALAWISAHPTRFVELCRLRAGLFWFGQDPRRDSRHSAGVAAADDKQAWIKWAMTLLSGAVAWLALALVLVTRRRERAVWLLAGVLLCFPLPYYLTHVSERYRFPIDSLIVYFDVWLVGTGLQRLRQRARRGAA
jgi:4-amino-4-deoxy-L-arabinose transferase-like glycosyltransferase